MHAASCAAKATTEAGRINTTKNSLPRGSNGAHKGAARDKPSRGAKRGAREGRYQATPGDVQRLKLLAEPHPATLRYGKDLYGMQEVRGSNPLSSTLFRAL